MSGEAGNVFAAEEEGIGSEADADVSFTLGQSDSLTLQVPASGLLGTGHDQSAELEAQLVREIVAAGPGGWRSADVDLTVTVELCRGRCVYLVGERLLSIDAPETMCEVARRLRVFSPQEHQGPWWGLRLRVDASGERDVVYDYGEQPPDELLPPEAYLADLREFPRGRLPVWLAAYLGHGDRQLRTPEQAAAEARAYHTARRRPELVENEFPDLPVMWARWASIAAVFTAVRSTRGPRMLPSFAWFESSRRSGSTLYALPGGRAVLSGGVWNAPALDAAYNDGAVLPDYYAGAPDWIANPVLNRRVGVGLLSFCYWWDAGRWHRGESPSAEQCAEAVPGVWTIEAVGGIVAGLIENRNGDGLLQAVVSLVRLAQAGGVTREAVREIFGDSGDFDIDGALYQFGLAGLLAMTVEPIVAEEAISRVQEYIRGRGYDTTGYPLELLTADRISCGWMVHVPVRSGQVAAGRAVFYVADDGILEHSTSSIGPTSYASGFAQRYRQRQGLTV
ncbi:MAG: hypothetical protein JWN03_8451 [Nocardia sp.]|uniref:hypothetical protein n=1 Tax=Nocardia sp. TaxID=1821 RepID=UPI00261C3F66|nr:hypothetical protein [Nocardia sp.]MCU1648176.1 hypothetical protein [Nocardia sp.]